MAINLKPTKVAAKYQGGMMTPRLNTGGTIDNITVTGTRSNPFDFGSNPFGVRRGSIYNDGTFDADIKGSSMMEDDAGYDEAYDYADRMRKQAKENIAKQASDVFTDTSSIAKPSFIDKAKNKISEYAGEEIDKTTDLTKTIVDLNNPLYVGTKVVTEVAKGAVNILNIFGKNLGISEGKLSADKFNTTISKPNNFVTGIIHGTIDRGADATKEIIGATDSEDQG